MIKKLIAIFIFSPSIFLYSLASKEQSWGKVRSSLGSPQLSEDFQKTKINLKALEESSKVRTDKIKSVAAAIGDLEKTILETQTKEPNPAPVPPPRPPAPPSRPAPPRQPFRPFDKPLQKNKTSTKTPYEVLGIARGSSPDIVEDHFQRLRAEIYDGESKRVNPNPRTKERWPKIEKSYTEIVASYGGVSAFGTSVSKARSSAAARWLPVDERGQPVNRYGWDNDNGERVTLKQDAPEYKWAKEGEGKYVRYNRDASSGQWNVDREAVDAGRRGLNVEDVGGDSKDELESGKKFRRIKTSTGKWVNVPVK
jgi:hypothetical protein